MSYNSRNSNNNGSGNNESVIKNILTDTPFAEEPSSNYYNQGMSSSLISSELKSDPNDCCFSLCTKSPCLGGKASCGKFKSKNHSFLFWLSCFTFTCLMVSVIVPVILYKLVDVALNEEVVIDSTDAPSYETWQTNTVGKGFDDVKIYYKLWFFDLQNPEDTLTGAKPKVMEKGPYGYHEYFVKFDIEWFDGGDTVTYNSQKYYIFDQDLTGDGLKEDDEFTLPYPALLGFEYYLSAIPPEVTAMITVMMNDELNQKNADIDAQMEVLITQIDSLETNIIVKRQLEEKVAATEESIDLLFNRLHGFVNQSSPTHLLLKNLLCQIPSGVSPYFKQKPGPAWFGWLNDPLLYAAGEFIKAATAESGTVVPWTSAVPGAAVNWTSIEDTRRRRSRDTLKTGKNNAAEVSRYVLYQNMTLMHTCVAAMDSQDPDAYVEGEQFPACTYYQNEWTEEEAEAAGFILPFGSDYANRVDGCDGNMYGRPVITDKIQAFISDIYRSVYLQKVSEEDWNGVPVYRFNLQEKDLLNATFNPENYDYYSFGPSGLLNATVASGVPVFISLPHFYLGSSDLVAAIEGISPDPDVHSLYLDIEPQSGLLARARKRLMVSYMVEDYYLPELEEDALEIANEICANLSSTIETLKPIIDDPTVLPDLNCTLATFTKEFDCLVQKSNWTFNNGGFLLPYGWTSEEVAMPDSYSDDIKDSLFLIENIADGIRAWCILLAIISFLMIVTLLLVNHLRNNEEGKGDWDSSSTSLINKGNPNKSNDPKSFSFSS